MKLILIGLLFLLIPAITANNSAIMVVTMIDAEWCRSTEMRTSVLAPIINNVIELARENGILIIHGVGREAVLDNYFNTIQRQKVLSMPYKEMVEEDIYFGENPVPHSNFFCEDSKLSTIIRRLKRLFHIKPRARKIHSLITLGENDIIVDSNLQEIYNTLSYYNISKVFLMGAHSNNCIINKPYGLKQLKKWGIEAVVVRDLVDSFYSSSKYTHLETNKLAIDYIEEYFAPTITSIELIEEIKGG